MSVKKTTILVVDDDIRNLRMLQRLLELEGYGVITADNGEAAIDQCYEVSPDIVLLDIVMPGLDGYEVCQRVRDFSEVPIMMVTARGDDDAKVKGLDAGADDYITKPFSAKELMARLRAMLRRMKPREEHDQPTMVVGDLTIDFSARRVSMNGKEIVLNATEYALLTYLAADSGRVITPGQILENVWGKEYAGESHILQVNVARLRQKLKDDAKNPKYIFTRPGIGYIMEKLA